MRAIFVPDYLEKLCYQAKLIKIVYLQAKLTKRIRLMSQAEGLFGYFQKA